jgi:GNAT superfamily N-acetyltransferase
MSAISTREVSVSDEPAVKHFVQLERRFVGSNALFYSEPDADITRALSGRSSFFTDMEHALFVASDNGVECARCAALINRRYQRAKNEAVGAIGYFAASPNSLACVRSMLERAEAWLTERGVTRIVAPFNGAGILGAGVRTEAFDEPPMFPFAWHPPHYSDYLREAGYTPTYPLWYYTIDFSSDAYRAMTRKVDEGHSSTIRPINKKRWDEDLEIFRNLFNETFRDEWEFHPMESDELHEFFDPMKPILDPRQMLIGEVGGVPVGWCLGMPDWSPLFRSFRGKVGPLQIIKLMLRSGRYQRAGLLGIGVLQDYRSTGLAHALAVALYRRYEERGLREALYYPVNGANARSRKFAESMGGRGRLMYHCYDKSMRTLERPGTTAEASR